MARATIESAGIRVAVLPAFGARVVSLVDKRCQRDWLFQGSVSANTGEEAVYLAGEAVGWDECFPTVGAFDARNTTWGRKLRDHGDLWGRPWTVAGHTDTSISTTYEDPLFRFTRALRVKASTLIADYEVVNRGEQSLPFLWALHALFSVTPADTIKLANAQSIVATHFALDDRPFDGPHAFAWPGPDDKVPISLDRVQPASRHMAAKLVASGIPSRSVTLGHAGEWLDIGWDEPLDDLGIWLNYGGWPAAGELHHIALEPTSAPADHLGQAIAGNAKTIRPGGRAAWRIRMTVGDRAPG